DRAIEHDLQRRDDSAGPAVVRLFPGLRRARNAQVGNRVADQPRLGLGAAPGRTLVAYFAARPRRRAGKGRDGGRMVMRLAFGDVMGKFFLRPIYAVSPGEKPLSRNPFKNRRIV